MRFVEQKGLIINEDFLGLLKTHGLDNFESLLNYSGGSLVKKKAERDVKRLLLQDGEEPRALYLKRHLASFGERLKRFSPFHPREDARNEWEKTILLRACGFSTPVPVAYGEGGKASLTLTEEIYGAVRVESHIPLLSSARAGMEGVFRKRMLIRRLGETARDFHAKGFNHQDFYIGHFFTRPSTGELFLIDLQRVQRRSRPARRWIKKDLAQFVFSASNTENFTRADLVRFGYAYLGKNGFDRAERKMIKRIFSKSRAIARHTSKMLERRKKLAG